MFKEKTLERYAKSALDVENNDPSGKFSGEFASLPKNNHQNREFLALSLEVLQPFAQKGTEGFSPWPEEKMEDLILSMEAYGLLSPIIVRPLEWGKFEILSGEHRWKAAKILNWTSISARIYHCDEQNAKAIFAITNLLHRENTLADKITWGAYYYDLLHSGKKSVIAKLEDEEIITPESLAKLSKKQLYRYHRLHFLPEKILERVKMGQITLTAGENLLRIDPSSFSLVEEFSEEIKTNQQAKKVLDLYENRILPYEFTTESLKIVLDGLEKKTLPSFSEMMKDVKKVLKKHLKEEDFGKIPELLEDFFIHYENQQES